MASAQINGAYGVYIVAPSGARRMVKTAPAFWWGPGGSSDGAIVSTSTPEKWNFLPLSAEAGAGGYSILVTLRSGAAKTTDASDSVIILPVQVDGQMQAIGNSVNASGLGNDNFIVDVTATDIAYVANLETPYYQVRAKDGVRQFRVGGDRVFMSLEDNA